MGSGLVYEMKTLFSVAVCILRPVLGRRCTHCLQVNAKFTEGLKDAIEISLDQGDEDMCTVSIGKLFLEASPMLGAFKSYCTRQVGPVLQILPLSEVPTIITIVRSYLSKINDEKK